MSPLTASRLARIHMEATTHAAQRPTRIRRRERRATARALWLAACCVGYFGWRVIA